MNPEEFKEAQTKVYSGIAGALFNCIPEEWYEAVLTLGPTVVDDAGNESMSHNLRNPELEQDTLASMEVFEQTRKLELLFRENAKPWTEVSFRVWWDDKIEQWRYRADYKYN